MRISDWSSDVCSSDLDDADQPPVLHHGQMPDPPPGDEPERAERRLIPRHRYGGRGHHLVDTPVEDRRPVLGKAVYDVALGKYAHHRFPVHHPPRADPPRSEGQKSELQSLMGLPYVVFCLTNNTYNTALL